MTTTTTTTFSLLQLPTKALKMVLTQDIDFMIWFSFCSNRSKSVVQNLQIDYLHIECGFSRQNVLYVMFGDTMLWASEYSTISDDMIEESVIIGQKLKHKLKAYIDHAYSVLNQPSFYVDVHCNEDGLRTYEFLENAIEDVKIRRTTLSGSGPPYLLNAKRFWRRFILPVQQIDLCQKLFETAVQSHRLLLQNFDYLGINLGSNGKPHSILAMNSAFISITNYCREFKRNDLNIYLKHWINGSNPSLEYMELYSYVRIEIDISLFVDEVFNGISKEIISKEYRKPTKYRKTHVIIGEQDNEITRGFEITRYDGTTADIWFHIPYPMVDEYRFEMFIEKCH
ncbi:F-box associated domain-containing protein [Caenorhabditis elegans]|uniref:F-box associated domain-containing protein n=1 Tax=Caenorhabditis elegans TaxID=6239 RepID=P91225_CAEEL|nr:F-box associated domain-containing protein [Caenorhabditis elegans]CCD61272.3 F-box associated domain-containing protein [Caenorhabditis elegans]